MLERLKLSRELKQVSRKYSAQLKRLRTEGRKEDLEAVEQEFFHEWASIEEELRWLDQYKLIQKARRIYVAIPSGKEAWEEAEDSITGKRFLTEAGIREIRLGIREERKARRDLWIGWIMPLTGLIGALTGLMAVLGSK